MDQNTEAINLIYDLPVWTLLSWLLLAIAIAGIVIVLRKTRRMERAVPLTLNEVNDLLPYVDLHRAASEALLTATLRGGPTALDRLEEAEKYGQRALRAASNPCMVALESGLLDTVGKVRDVIRQADPEG